VQSPTRTTGLTYEDWMRRPETNRIEELIDGELVVSPAASFRHQQAVMNLLAAFHAHAKASRDVVLPAPFDVVVDARTVVQPDVVYVRRERLPADPNARPFTVPPDLVVEVLSSNRAYDLVRKRRIFERHGITEVWFVDTEARRIEQVVLDDGRYRAPLVHEDGATVASTAVPGLTVAVTEILGDEDDRR
jgi:Uma2 family endonuclease